MGKRYTCKYFTKGNNQMANKYIKKVFLILLVIRKLQIKSTLKYKYLPTRMAKILKTKQYAGYSM